MDNPPRQSYTIAVVHPSERSAAGGIATVARSIGAALSPMLAGYLLSVPALMSVPFFIAGGVKILYDLLLYRAFVANKAHASIERQFAQGTITALPQHDPSVQIEPFAAPD